MKRSILIILGVLLTVSSYSYPNSGRSVLELSLWNNERFSVVIDNQIYSEDLRIYRIDNLIPGNHFIKVTKKEQKPNGFISHVIYRGNIFIKAGSVISARITHNKGLDILSIRPILPVNGNSGVNSHNGNHNGSHGINSNGHTGINSHGNNSGETYISAISDYSFSLLKQTIRNTAFDSNRLGIAKSAIRENYLYSSQVLELMELMTFESNRLDLAKFAYLYTLDKGNYFVVHNAFSFGSSITALNHYIYTLPV